MTVRFPLCLLGSPAFVGKPVDGNNQSGSVSPVVAVDENRLIFGCIEDCEHLPHFCVGGPANPAYGNVEVVETQCARVLCFGTYVFVGSAQINNAFLHQAF